MKTFVIAFWMLLAPTLVAGNGGARRLTAADGLLTKEVHQLVELPDGRMLVNCEGAFCLTDGRGFVTIPCDYRLHSLRMNRHAKGYAHCWEGDSLLWLRDFYRLYLFDVRRMAFREMTEARYVALADSLSLTRAEEGVTAEAVALAEGIGITDIACCATDRQGGTWIGTRAEGIVYFPPARRRAETLAADDRLRLCAEGMTDSQGRLWHWRGHHDLYCYTPDGRTDYHPGNVRGMRHNQVNFACELPDGRMLMCYTLRELGYLDTEGMTFDGLRRKIPALEGYRYFVGACPLDARWTAVYSQNGTFLLDTQADTVALFPPEEVIGHYTEKYNCMVRDGEGALWIGTQNGLFRAEHLSDDTWQTVRIEGLGNDCIRSLVADRDGHLWAGTECGISRVTPAVINLGAEDGTPTLPMAERAACLTADGRLVFCHDGGAVAFCPEWLIGETDTPLPVVLIRMDMGTAKGESVTAGVGEAVLLPHTRNYLTFTFSALNYANPMRTRYRYRLHGLEEEWQTYADRDGSRATVEYRALPPGEYLFEAQAATGDNVWGTSLRVPVTICPPFWLTWWAKAIYLLLLLSLAVLGVAIYIRKKKRKLERENDDRVNRLFELREEARHRFAEETRIDPKKIGINSEEEALMARLLHAVEQHLAQTDYGVEQLARDVALSRTNLYERMRNMLGITPSDFIRNVRLKCAARLLVSEPSLSIADIALRVGFGTPRLFSSHFKKMFGVLPSEYKE